MAREQAVKHESQLQSLAARGSALFCLELVDRLPPFPHEFDDRLGRCNVVLLDAAVAALLAATAAPDVELHDVALSLNTLAAVAKRKAQEIREAEYRPGDNYGFSGPADTSSYI